MTMGISISFIPNNPQKKILLRFKLPFFLCQSYIACYSTVLQHQILKIHWINKEKSKFYIWFKAAMQNVVNVLPKLLAWATHNKSPLFIKYAAKMQFFTMLPFLKKRRCNSSLLPIQHFMNHLRNTIPDNNNYASDSSLNIFLHINSSQWTLCRATPTSRSLISLGWLYESTTLYQIKLKIISTRNSQYIFSNMTAAFKQFFFLEFLSSCWAYCHIMFLALAIDSAFIAYSS